MPHASLAPSSVHPPPRKGTDALVKAPEISIASRRTGTPLSPAPLAPTAPPPSPPWIATPPPAAPSAAPCAAAERAPGRCAVLRAAWRSTRVLSAAVGTIGAISSPCLGFCTRFRFSWRSPSALTTGPLASLPPSLTGASGRPRPANPLRVCEDSAGDGPDDGGCVAYARAAAASSIAGCEGGRAVGGSSAGCRSPAANVTRRRPLLVLVLTLPRLHPLRIRR